LFFLFSFAFAPLTGLGSRKNQTFVRSGCQAVRFDL